MPITILTTSIYLNNNVIINTCKCSLVWIMNSCFHFN